MRWWAYSLQIVCRVPVALMRVDPPAGMNTPVSCPLVLKVSYAPQPLSTCRLAIVTGKFGVVAQPSSLAFGLFAGGVQALALGSVIHVPLMPDRDEFTHRVPSVEVRDSSKV